MVFQILFALLFAGAIVLTWRRVRQQAIRVAEGAFWTILWATGIALVWRPEVTDVLANFFGVGRGADLILYVSVIVLFFFSFLLVITLDRLERQMTKLVQHQALEEFRRQRQNGSSV